jgi:hypothetical protein
MPTFDGATGRVYYKAWRVPSPRTQALAPRRQKPGAPAGGLGEDKPRECFAED